MRLLADESVDRPVVERLREDGHEVLYVAEMEAGISDAVVLDRARAAEALLLTADKDFGELVFRQRRLPRGVVLVRMAGRTLGEKAEAVSRVLGEHASELEAAFAVAEPGRLRIRRMV